MRRRAPLVGRDREVRLLADALRAAATDSADGGVGRVLLVAAEAGAGKSRLVEEFLDAHPDVPRLVGGCVELSQAAVPYLPLAGALRALVAERGDAAAAELLSGAAAPLLTLLPRLRTEDVRGREQDPLRLYEAVPELLDRLAPDGPAVLVIEDVHWADASTLDLVRFLAMTRMPRRLVLMTLRSDELRRRHPLRPLLAELARLPSTQRIDLAPLADDDVVDLVAALAQPGSLLAGDLIARRAEGNPFFVEELVAASGEGGTTLPAPLEDVLGTRLDRLPETAWAVVEVLAAIGRRASHGLLEAVAGIDPDRLSGGLRAAVEDGVVTADDRGYAFRHALLQEAAYDRVLAGDRVRLHRRIARALVDDPGLAEGGSQSAAAEVAFHAERGGDLETAYVASVRAAERANDSYAVAEAHAHYERAVSLLGRVSVDDGPDAPTLLHTAAAAAFAAGEPARACAHLEAALAATPPDHDIRIARIIRDLAEAQWFAGETDAGRDVSTRGLELIGAEPSAARAELLAQRAMKLILADDLEGALELGLEELDISRGHGTLLGEIRALEAVGCVECFGPRDVELGLQCQRHALDLARDSGDLASYNHATANLATSLEYLGRQRESQAVVAECIAHCEAEGYAGAMLDFQRCNLVSGLLRSGAWDEAAAVLARLRFARAASITRVFQLTMAATLALHRGRVEEAAGLVALAEEVAGADGGGSMFQAPLEDCRATICAARGDGAGVRAAVEKLCAFEPQPWVMVAYPRIARVIADAVATDRSWALGTLDLLVARLIGHLEDPAVAAAPLVAADGRRMLRIVEAERARARGTGGATEWRAVLEVDVDQPQVAEQLYVEWRLAEALHAAGEPCAEVLLAAYERARAIGSAVTEDLVALARRARVRLPGAQRDGRDDLVGVLDHGLTPREREVLALVARGATNQGIADELVISAKTASVHVSNILAKLGAANRSEAGAIARDLGL